MNDFTRNLQDLLYTNLILKGMSVVEREKLEEVLREQKIAYAGIIDLATAAQVGKRLGVEGVVVGSVAELGNPVAITARLVDVEKGTSMTAARVELAKTAEMGTLLGRGSRGMTAKAPAEPSSPGGSPEVVAGTPPPLAAPPPEATKPVKHQEFPKVRVEVEGLQVGSDGKVIVFLNYINKTQEELNIMLGSPQEKAFVIDDTGNRYAYSSSSGLSGQYSSQYPKERWYGQPMLLTPGTRATASLTFDPRNRETGKLFSFTSEQALVKQTGDKKDARLFNISIRNIEPW